MEELLIVSSTEALGVVDVVERVFSEQGYRVSRWNKDFFRVNDNYRQTLTDAAGFYDYAVAIFAADDPATIRDKPVMVTRANVVFEFGLFLGRLGPDRAYCLTEDHVTGFSDWDGITEVRYRRTSDSDIEAACERVLRKIRPGNAARPITNLPSTALALGYWHYYLQPVLSAFEHAGRYHARQIDHSGKVIVDEQVVIPRPSFPTITVKLPARISRLAPDSLARETRRYRHISVPTPGGRLVSLYAETGADICPLYRTGPEPEVPPSGPRKIPRRL